VIFRIKVSHTSNVAWLAILFATVPVLCGQSSRSLDWHLEQQPTSVPCNPGDIAFVNAPEQVFLENSYNLLPHFPEWRCESIKASAFNEARVLIVSRGSTVDDGVAYSLIQPNGSTNVRLLPMCGGLSRCDNEDDRHQRAAMNAMLQTTKYGQPETIDWLGLGLAYLTISGEAPSLADLHYSPGPTDRHFESYTVPGLLTELPALTRKHLLPTLTCVAGYCKVRFYYKTEPVEPLKVADFEFRLQDQTLSLVRARIQNYAAESGKNKSSH
jgi:hypothetical protein